MMATRVVERYELVSEISSGGMATVYLGRVRGAVGFARTVAIKRLHPHLAKDREFVSMLIDEGRLASRIRHPNVVPTLDVLEDGGELLLVMEYVHGESLSAIVRAVKAAGGSFPSPIAAAIVSGMLLGLHAAHEATDEAGRPLNVVHRDVSPHNVLVGADGVTRVVDFGVSKATGRLQSTGEGTIKGKLAYMAPESFRRSVELDRRADVYAAAVVLWELLTGQRLFAGDHSEVVAKVLSGEVAPPSSLVPDLSPALDEVVMCGLDFSPEGRYPTARSMERALHRATPVASTFEVAEWLEKTLGPELRARTEQLTAAELDPPRPAPPVGEIAAVEVSTLHLGPRPKRATRWLWAALPFALVASAAGLAITRWHARRAETPPSASLAYGPPSSSPTPGEPSAAPVAQAPSFTTEQAPAPPASAARPSAGRPGAGKRGATSSASVVPAGSSQSANQGKSAACAVPYTVDAQGSTHFLVECMQK
jgi:serine/threonine-protein kinase